MLKIVLYQPEIPGNTGSIGRTCVALNCPLILIKPYGFDISEKSVRRAGLDYWKHIRLTEYEDWNNFLELENAQKDQLYFIESTGASSIYQAQFKNDSYLIFGGETKGIPINLLQDYPNQVYHLPMFSDHIRSLNLANTATTAAYLYLAQHFPN